jgi:hypothetical protein
MIHPHQPTTRIATACLIGGPHHLQQHEVPNCLDAAWPHSSPGQLRFLTTLPAQITSAYLPDQPPAHYAIVGRDQAGQIVALHVQKPHLP